MCIDVVIPIGAQEGIHIVILRLMSHEEEVPIAVVMQHRGQALVVRDVAPLHEVAEHQGGE